MNRPWDPSKRPAANINDNNWHGHGADCTKASGTLVPVVAGTTYTFSALVMTEGNSGNVTLLLYGKNAADTVYAIEGTSSVVSRPCDHHERSETGGRVVHDSNGCGEHRESRILVPVGNRWPRDLHV